MKTLIVDYILDRKADEDSNIYEYDAHDFYIYVSEESEIFGFTDIARALDTGTESDVKRVLCDYIDNGDYNPAIKDYINSRMWTISDSELDRYNELKSEIAERIKDPLELIKSQVICDLGIEEDSDEYWELMDI